MKETRIVHMAVSRSQRTSLRIQFFFLVVHHFLYIFTKFNVCLFILYLEKWQKVWMCMCACDTTYRHKLFPNFILDTNFLKASFRKVNKFLNIIIKCHYVCCWFGKWNLLKKGRDYSQFLKVVLK